MLMCVIRYRGDVTMYCPEVAYPTMKWEWSKTHWHALERLYHKHSLQWVIADALYKLVKFCFEFKYYNLVNDEGDDDNTNNVIII